ncbi:hypothetical protein QYF36_002460 [Acer negundo]|nr:hypothetical protein QYF36_002460 [Acer negundo]
MAVKNEYREEDQNVTENVNVSKVDNQPEYVNVDSTVAEADNLTVVRYVPQNDEHIQQTENVAQNEHALDNEDLDQYLLTGLPEILPTQMEVKEDYWKDIDDDICERPQFVPLKISSAKRIELSHHRTTP